MQEKVDGFPKKTLSTLKSFCLWSSRVNKIKQMGNMVSKVIEGGQLDMKVKNAKYVDENNTVQLNHS